MRLATGLLISASVLICARAFAQTHDLQPERVVASETETATCYGSTNQKLVGSMLVRSRVLVSPNGNYQAYTENEAVTHAPTGVECVNTAKLFVKGPGDKEFRLAYLQEPSRYELWNNIKIVDWSPDSHSLLAELGIGQWGSDFGGNSPLLYDVQDGVFSPQDMVNTAFSIHVGHDCSWVAQTVGFAPDGGVVLRVRPTFDDENVMDQNSCIKKEGLWLLKDGVKPLPGTYKVRRYGRFVPGR